MPNILLSESSTFSLIPLRKLSPLLFYVVLTNFLLQYSYKSLFLILLPCFCFLFCHWVRLEYGIFENPACFLFLFVESFPYFGAAILFGDHGWEYWKYYFLLESPVWFAWCLVGSYLWRLAVERGYVLFASVRFFYKKPFLQHFAVITVHLLFSNLFECTRISRWINRCTVPNHNEGSLCHFSFVLVL